MVFCPVEAVVALESQMARCVHCEEEVASSLQLKVCSIHGTEVVLTTGKNVFFCGSTGIVIDCVIDFHTHSTRNCQ
jgi:hypothetical protein